VVLTKVFNLKGKQDVITLSLPVNSKSVIFGDYNFTPLAIFVIYSINTYCIRYILNILNFYLLLEFAKY
jgi:hypothetical protein